MTDLKSQEFYKKKINALLSPIPKQSDFEGVFDGPSIDHHVWALDFRQRARSSPEAQDAFTRSIFSVLVSWGMHRMGPSGAKMPRYEKFRRTVNDAWKNILKLWDKTPDLGPKDWEILQDCFQQIHATTTDSKLVATSKTLCHLLPSIVAPIDRQYTLTFLELKNKYTNCRHSKHDAKDCDWIFFREIQERFFYPLVRDERFESASNWTHEMCTSNLKRADNLIVAFMRANSGP